MLCSDVRLTIFVRDWRILVASDLLAPALTLGPLQFFIAMCASFLQRRQQTLIEYLIEENLVLRKKLGPKRLSVTDAERRRLALKAKSLGRNMLCK